MFTDPMIRNDRADTHTDTQSAGIYEVRSINGLRCRDIHTKFHKDWSRDLKYDGRDTLTNRKQDVSILLISFS
jgi:tricorn protease-like protein